MWCVLNKGQIDGDGFERQLKAILKYAVHNHIKLIKVFRDEGVSGTLENRPALGEMLIAIEDNGIDAVIIEKLDRLARDLIVQENIIRELKQRNITLLSALEPEDMLSEDPTRKLIRQVLGAIAEYNKSMTVLKLRAARERKRAKEGKCEGAKPYGETPEEQKVIAYIKSLRRAHKGDKLMSFNRIAKKLNAVNIPTKQGKTWSAMQIKRICESKTYKETYILHELPGV